MGVRPMHIASREMLALLEKTPIQGAIDDERSERLAHPACRFKSTLQL